MIIIRMLVSAALCLLLTSCSSTSVFSGLYEGARVKSQLDNSPSERMGATELPTDYQQYERLRKEMVQRNTPPAVQPAVAE